MQDAVRSGGGRLLLAGLLLLLVAPAPALAQSWLRPEEDYALRLEYLWWSPQPRGELQKGLGDSVGTLLDIETALGVESGRAHDLHGAIRLGGSWKLVGGWSPLDFQGDTLAPFPFVYGTLTARGGDRVLTSLKGHYLTGALQWDFMSNRGGFLGGLVGLKYFDVDAVMVNADTSERVAEGERLPIPVLGLAGRAYFEDWFSLEGQISGITIGSRGHLWEWLLALRVHFNPHLAATGGYHRISIEGRDDRDFFNLRLGQWTFGVEISL
jgi:hypothetical protein